MPDRHTDIGALELPDLGASADGILTPISEQRLGQAFMRSVRKSMKVLDEPLVNDYLQSLGKRLVASAGGGGMPFSFFVIDDPRINAFAGPAGHIGVFSGLILTAESESELAAVLAHEVAHVTQRHLLRSVEDQQKLMGPAAILLIAAAILGAQVSPDAGIAAAVGAQAALAQHQKAPKAVTRKGIPVFDKNLERLGRALLRKYAPSYRVAQLARLIRKLGPDVIHAIEMQAAGYLMVAAKERMKGELPPSIITSWGSDIYLFGTAEGA